jgi:hypothetical protein
VKLVRWSVLVVAVAAAGCGSDSKPKPSPPPHKTPGVVSVGQPVAPRFVKELGPGWDEMRARSPAAAGRPVWRIVAMRRPPHRPRDVCVTLGLAAQDLAEADTRCDLSAAGSGAVTFLDVPGIPDRFGPSPTVISGVAPAEVRAVRLEGVGGTHALPLSAHRAFAAVYVPRARGTVRVVSLLGDGKAVQTYKLPPRGRTSLFPPHKHRRRGALFGEEVGEPITQLTYRQVVHRFGPPAVVRREHGLRCAYYEVVGDASDGWQFCFRSNGQMEGALGNTPPPRP